MDQCQPVGGDIEGQDVGPVIGQGGQMGGFAPGRGADIDQPLRWLGRQQACTWYQPSWSPGR
jgi:hypothetical protein